jgi:hypothetical protein
VTSPELENLVRIGRLKQGPCSAREFAGLVRSGTARLADASNPALSLERVVGMDERLHADLMEAAQTLQTAVSALPALDATDGSL